MAGRARSAIAQRDDSVRRLCSLAMSAPAPSAHEPGGPAHHLEPALRVGLGTLSRVAGALVGPGGLAELALAALEEMRGALDLEAAALYLPAGADAHALERRVASPE